MPSLTHYVALGRTAAIHFDGTMNSGKRWLSGRVLDDIGSNPHATNWDFTHRRVAYDYPWAVLKTSHQPGLQFNSSKGIKKEVRMSQKKMAPM